MLYRCATTAASGRPQARLPRLEPLVDERVECRDDGEGDEVVDGAGQRDVDPLHLCREVDLAVELALDHEREVPEARVDEDGRHQEAADHDQQERDPETL